VFLSKSIIWVCISRCTEGLVNGTNTCFNVVWVFGDVKNVLVMIGVRIGEGGRNLEIFWS